MPHHSPTLLYVEDEEADRFLVETAFRLEGAEGVVRTVEHGRAAIEYLSGVGEYADRQAHPLPCLVLLDLNLPEVHGFDVLKWIRSEPSLSDLPVVVFSSSIREEDQHRAKMWGANDFIQKVGSIGKLREVARQLLDRWVKPR